MSKQEIKDEFKDTEGNPQIKGKIKQLQYQMAARRMMKKVPEADVVVTNPTHYAVALKYDPNGTTAPLVVAKGVDEIAEKLRKLPENLKFLSSLCHLWPVLYTIQPILTVKSREAYLRL